MTLNIDALREAVAWAEAEAAKPDGSWDQQNWASGTATPDPADTWSVVCGTAFCIAGHLCAAAGDTFLVPTRHLFCYAPGEQVKNVEANEVEPSGTTSLMTVLDRAIELLGLDTDPFDSALMGLVIDEEYGVGVQRGLFNAANTIEQVRSIATQIAARHGHVL